MDIIHNIIITATLKMSINDLWWDVQLIMSQKGSYQVPTYS